MFIHVDIVFNVYFLCNFNLHSTGAAAVSQKPVTNDFIHCHRQNVASIHILTVV